MKLYLIERSAIYRHGIFGVYDTLELARKAKALAKSLEPDDHHDFKILEYTLNDTVDFNKSGDFCYSPRYNEIEVE